MASDQGPVVQSALLRNELIRLRKESGLTQDQVAAAMDWSQSKLIRMEGGRSSITKVDLDALLTTYRISSERDRERLQELNRGARARAWWASYGDEIDPTYLEYVGYEAGAVFIRSFEQVFIPGLVQTPEYAEVLTRLTINPPEAEARVDSTVGLRLRRQEKLAERSQPPRQYYVIDEAVIRRHIGISQDPDIMPNQLRHLAERARREELLTVRVIPFKAGAYQGPASPFTLLEFDSVLPDVLYRDAGRDKTLIAGGDRRIVEYADDFETLLQSALSSDESIELIEQAAEDIS
jgi:transcriptional regulator with XRE-family HTH domain